MSVSEATFGNVPPRLRGTLPSVDVQGFFQAVGDAQQEHLDRYGIAQELRPLYVEEWPKERLAQPGSPFDFIGFHTILTRRGSLSNTAYVPSKGLLLLNEEPNLEAAGYLKQDWGWKEEAIVQFTIFSQSNARAEAVMNWLRGLILLYASLGYFKSRGVNHLVFHNRLEDTVEKTQQQDLYTRRIQFLVHLQNIFNLEEKTLENFTFNLGLNDGTSVSTVTVAAPDLTSA